MGSGWEKFRNAGSLKTLLNKPKSGSETSTSGANDNGIECMVNYCVLFE
jgi:hypothetical protein